MGRQRPREFQNLKPSAARLYFIFLSHFIMPLLRKKIWCDAGRVYGSTVFHATRRIPESERIWRIILVATVCLVVSKYIQRCGFFWKITHLPFVFGTNGPYRPTSSITMQPSERPWLSFGPLLAWREGVMHQWSSNEKCYTIIESTELRRTHTANRSTILFNLRGTLAFSHVER